MSNTLIKKHIYPILIWKMTHISDIHLWGGMNDCLKSKVGVEK